MRILLVKPKPRLGTILGLQRFQMLEPLELGYLAAALPAGHDVRVLDLRRARRAEPAFLGALARYRPDLIGFTGYTHEASAVKHLARVARAAAATVRIVVGGHHATMLPGDFHTPDIDYVVRGAGCAAFRALVESLERGEEPVGVPGLLRTGDGWDTQAATARPEVPDPASLPAPRRDLWDHRAYYATWLCAQPADWQRIWTPVAMVRTSFGCRMRCSFCVVPHIYDGRHLPRPVGAVVDEIAALPVDHVYFADDENFIDADFSRALADALAERGVRKRYFAWARSTTITRFPDVLRRWRAIGLDAVFVGFEYASDDELRHARKGATLAVNEEAHAVLAALGIALHAAFMIHPEYSRADFARLADYVAGMPPAEFSFTVCTPSPGTPDYDAMRSRMWVDHPYDFHDCAHPLVPTALPLREFADRVAGQLAAGERKNPLKTARRMVRPGEIVRAQLAMAGYRRSYRTMYRDYPRPLWAAPGRA